MTKHHSSDSQLNKSTDYGEGLPTFPDFVSQRSKRPREEISSPSQLTGFKEEMKELISSLTNAQKNDLNSINAVLQEIKESNSNINSTMSLLAAQNEEFRNKISLLELQAKKDREYISILEEKIEDLQRTSRKTCLELKNVPKKDQESRDDLINIVVNLSKTIKLDLTDRDINDIVRLKARSEVEKKPTIIVELRSSILRNDLLKKVKDFNANKQSRLQAKHLGLTRYEDTPVYVSEQLTSKGARLYFLARDLKRSKKVKYCWTAHGKVLVRKDDSSKTIHITSEAQVLHLSQVL